MKTSEKLFKIFYWTAIPLLVLADEKKLSTNTKAACAIASYPLILITGIPAIIIGLLALFYWAIED